MRLFFFFFSLTAQDISLSGLKTDENIPQPAAVFFLVLPKSWGRRRPASFKLTVHIGLSKDFFLKKILLLKSYFNITDTDEPKFFISTSYDTL